MGKYLDSKQFMVTWAGLYENEIHMEQVEALHRMHALIESKQPFITLEDTHRVPFWDNLMQVAYNKNGLVSVMEIV